MSGLFRCLPEPAVQGRVGAGNDRHNLSEVFQEFQQGVCRCVASGHCVRRCGSVQRALLDAQVGMQVCLGRFNGVVAQPEGNDRGVDARGEHPHGVGVPLTFRNRPIRLVTVER